MKRKSHGLKESPNFEKTLKNVAKELELFYERMEPLKDKMLALLMELAPSYEVKEGLKDFRNYNFFFKGSLGMQLK